jgi:hypothetical protein
VVRALLEATRDALSPHSAQRDARWPAGAYVAEFTDERAFVVAVEELRKQGYTRLETYTPFPVPGTFAALGAESSILPLLVFLGALAGGAIAYWIQWFTNAVSYPLNIGGRPTHAAPAFFIPTFEGLILIASLTAFGGLLLLLRLPRPWHPIFEVEGIERASIDHFWVAIDASDRRSDPQLTPRALERLRALRVLRAPAEP